MAGSVPLITDIQRAVADYFGTRLLDMRSGRRAQSVVRPRWIAIRLAYELTPHSMPMIGRHFGGLHHTTIMHALRRTEQIMAEDREFAASIEFLRGQLA